MNTKFLTMSQYRNQFKYFCSKSFPFLSEAIVLHLR